MTLVSALRPWAVQSGTIMWQPAQGSKVLRSVLYPSTGSVLLRSLLSVLYTRQIEMSHLNVIKCRTCKMIWNCAHCHVRRYCICLAYR
jgi:hypothetical protein